MRRTHSPSSSPVSSARAEKAQQRGGAMSVAGAGAGEETPLPACDFCAGLPAVVYCRADSARLCLPCDRHVHGANTVSTRHARAPLCAACRAAAAAFRRGAAGCGGGFLCSDCDFEEGSLRDGGDPPPLHDLGAVEVYVGCPSIAKLAAVLGVGGGEKAAAVAGDGDGDGWWPAWEEPQVLRLEDVIVPTTSCHGLQPLLTPSSPKNRSSGGKLAEEVIRQLGELAKSEAAEAEQFPSWASSEYAIGDGNFGAFDTEACNEAASMSVSVPSCEGAWVTTDDSNGACAMAQDAAHEEAPATASSPAEPSLSSFVAISEICPSMAAIGSSVGDVDHNGSSKLDAAEATIPQQQQQGAAAATAKKPSGYDVAYPDRGTVISRYKEKRKNRRFDKQIRYESRKARADGRLRIKGRFAKSGEAS